MVRVGVWEAGRFVGAIMFGPGANRHIARPFKLKDTEVCELVRVALAPASVRKHPTSKCVAISLRMLKRQSPGLRLVVSYADLGQGHRGVIYQAGGWLYLGAATQPYLQVNRKIVHPRSLYERFGRGGQSVAWLRANVDPNAQRVKMPAKLKYIMPLDREMREKLEPLAQPYMKRVGNIGSDVPATPGGKGRCDTTPALQLSQVS